MTYITAEDVAMRCTYARPMGDGFICSCPLHDDTHPSMKVTPGDKATMLWCHTGCNTKDILIALQLRPEQLFYDYSPDKNADTLSLEMELRVLKRELDPPPPIPETLLGLMSEAFSLPQPWHDAGLDAVANTLSAGDRPSEAMKYRRATKDIAVVAYFTPWCRDQGMPGTKIMMFAEWGMNRLQDYYRKRRYEVYG